MTSTAYPRLRLRIVFSPDAMIGPGKADMLELIRDTGSISAAGRAMGMSYKRAWMLVETMNSAFREPVVDSVRGGSGGGGARLTPTGEAVLAHFRQIEDRLAEDAASEIGAIARLLKPAVQTS